MQNIKKCCSCLYHNRQEYKCTHPENYGVFTEEDKMFYIRKCGPLFGCINHSQKPPETIQVDMFLTGQTKLGA